MRIMIADPSLEVVFHATSPGPLSAPLPTRQHHGVRTAGTQHSVGCGKVSCMWPVIRIFGYQGAKGERGLILSLYTVYSQKGAKIREKFAFSVFFSARYLYTLTTLELHILVCIIYKIDFMARITTVS